ncbi:MAG: DNA polymerase III subunit beta [bacterium]|nr:DNA polymerase III subunit beta [bacterium]
MKVSVLQENLSKGLNLTARVVASKTTLPILSNVLISTEKSRLKLSATNLETGVNLWIGAKIEEEGALTIPAKVLNEFIGSLPPEKIEMISNETSLWVTSGSFKANFVGTAAGEFPQLPTFENAPVLVFKKEELVKGLSQVAFAAAQDEGRPVLTGVLIRNTGDLEVTLVATDGYRLSLKKIKCEEKNFEGDLLIPGKTLLEVARLAQEKSEDNAIRISLTPEKSQAIFALSDIEFSTRLLEGEFPDFAKIIPQSYSVKAEFDKEEFLRAVKVASIFAREQANIVKLQIESGKVIVTAETPQVGNNESEISAKTEGEKLEIAFNCRFMIDFLNTTKGEELVFEAGGPLAPGVFKVKGEDQYLHIIMPVRLQS